MSRRPIYPNGFLWFPERVPPTECRWCTRPLVVGAYFIWCVECDRLITD